MGQISCSISRIVILQYIVSHSTTPDFAGFLSGGKRGLPFMTSIGGGSSLGRHAEVTFFFCIPQVFFLLFLF